MANIYKNNYVFNCILNNYKSSYLMYYNETNNTFFFHDWELDGPALEHWVALPFEEDCKRRAWKIFYANLSENDMALVKSHDGVGSFFAFMRSNHLIDIYNDAWACAYDQEFAIWEKRYGLTIDWETAKFYHF